MDPPFKSKRARFSGDSRVSGKAIARVLAQEGALAMLLARDCAALAAAAAERSVATGSTMVGVSAETRQDDQLQHAVADAQGLPGDSIEAQDNVQPNRLVLPARLSWRRSPARRSRPR